MDIETVRSFINMMKLADKIALTGGGITVGGSVRPRLNEVTLCDGLMPYDVQQPLQVALGCTFSSEICHKVSTFLAAEACKRGDAFFGTVRAGLIRDPMAATAGEFFSEDPYLTALLLKSYSSPYGMGFVYTDCLGQGRFENRTIDKRALYELYLYPLIQAGSAAAAVQLDGGRLNGADVCSTQYVTDIYSRYIRPDAMLISPYASEFPADEESVNGVYKLGGDGAYRDKIRYAVDFGGIYEGKLDGAVLRTLASVVNAHDFYRRPMVESMLDAQMPNIVVDSTVLLKNDGVLPISVGRTMAVFGDKTEFEDGALYDVMPVKDASKKLGLFNVFLITGYERDGIDAETVKAICEVAEKTETAVVVCGLCATPLPFVDKVNAVLYCPDRPTVAEIVVMLTGESPRGRLPFTWCKSKDAYPCNNKKYRARGDFRYESMFNGHLLFDTFDTGAVLFPFGHGLGYTGFELSNLDIKNDWSVISADFDVKNTGHRTGTAVCQVYVSLESTSVYGLHRRLVGVKHVTLGGGKSERTSVKIDLRGLAVYDDNDEWSVAGGRYKVEIGLSSQDIKTMGEIKVAAGSRLNAGLNQKTAPSYYATGKKFAPTAPEIEKLLKVPFIKKPDVCPELKPAPAATVKKLLKKAEKWTSKALLPLLKAKIEATPQKNLPV